jgi:hypothetical protein
MWGRNVRSFQAEYAKGPNIHVHRLYPLVILEVSPLFDHLLGSGTLPRQGEYNVAEKRLISTRLFFDPEFMRLSSHTIRFIMVALQHAG